MSIAVVRKKNMREGVCQKLGWYLPVEGLAANFFRSQEQNCGVGNGVGVCKFCMQAFVSQLLIYISWNQQDFYSKFMPRLFLHHWGVSVGIGVWISSIFEAGVRVEVESSYLGKFYELVLQSANASIPLAGVWDDYFSTFLNVPESFWLWCRSWDWSGQNRNWKLFCRFVVKKIWPLISSSGSKYIIRNETNIET